MVLVGDDINIYAHENSILTRNLKVFFSFLGQKEAYQNWGKGGIQTHVTGIHHPKTSPTKLLPGQDEYNFLESNSPSFPFYLLFLSPRGSWSSLPNSTSFHHVTNLSNRSPRIHGKPLLPIHRGFTSHVSHFLELLRIILCYCI